MSQPLKMSWGSALLTPVTTPLLPHPPALGPLGPSLPSHHSGNLAAAPRDLQTPIFPKLRATEPVPCFPVGCAQDGGWPVHCCSPLGITLTAHAWQVVCVGGGDPHLPWGSRMLFTPPSLTLIFKQRLDRVCGVVRCTFFICTHCVAIPSTVSPTRLTSAVEPTTHSLAALARPLP